MTTDSTGLESQLQAMMNQVWNLAQERQEDSQAVLSLLQALESLHRDIREQIFLPSLPNTRHELEKLLREIEEKGGWPYIERMKLQAFLRNFPEFNQVNSETDKLAGKSGEG